jgi:hypothetical protein
LEFLLLRRIVQLAKGERRNEKTEYPKTNRRIEQRSAATFSLDHWEFRVGYWTFKENDYVRFKGKEMRTDTEESNKASALIGSPTKDCRLLFGKDEIA